MPGGWMRKWRGGRGAEEPARAPVLAAARGAPLSELLGLSARTLLAAACADRAGLWLSGDRRGEPRSGCVVEAEPGPIPEEWKRLDVSTPFLRAALENPSPLHVELIARDAPPHLGPLMGMHSAIWIPLRERGRTIGLAMVAYARAPGRPDVEALRSLADEIMLAVEHQRNARRSDLAADEIRVRLRLSRAILSGVSEDSVLPQIARAARQCLQAEFVAVGRGGVPPLSGEGWDGAAGWRALLHDESVGNLWGTVFQSGRESEISAEEFGTFAGTAAEFPGPVLERVAAVPLHVRGETRGVLLAGLLPAEDPTEDLAQLESYAQLAASAVENELAREERAEAHRAVRKMVEESAECLLIIDKEGKILEASGAAAMLLFTPWGRRDGLALEELFSSVARDAVREWRERLDGAASGAKLAVVPKREGPPPILEAALHRGGTVRMQMRSKFAGTVTSGPWWLIHVEDSAAQHSRRQVEERLESELAGLLDSIDSGVLLLDADGRIVRASDRLAAIFGIDSQRMLEMGTLDALMASLAGHLVRPAETVARWRERVRRGEEASWDEFELTRPSRKIVERFARPLLSGDGSRIGWLEVYRDITGQRLIQSKLLQTEKMAALGQLVSGIAHELNNPLTSIQGYAQLLLSRRSTSQRSGDALRISQEAERAARIVKNLLLFSREAKPERRAVQINEVIDRTISLRAYELKVQNIAMEIDLDPGLPQTLADAAQLQQVVLNLIVNAEQAIVAGRGDEARNGRISIRTRRLAGDRLGMEVSDDGPGIAPEIVARVFDPFFTTKPPGVGTGLGLSIVYGIVQEHGGEVRVESEPGSGATLAVELPALTVSGFGFAEEKPAIERRAAAVVSLPVMGWQAAREEILIVEDEPTVAALIADVLTEEGYRVDTLLDSREALGRLEKKSYSLVICDLKMPHTDGPGLYRALVRRENPVQHKLLFVTGDTMSPRTIEFLNSSALPYLAKPFLVEELKDAVRGALVTIQTNEESAEGAERSRAAAKDQ